MKRVVIAGARHRGWNDAKGYGDQEGSPEDHAFLKTILDDVRFKNPEAYIITQGCDRGFGRLIKAVAVELGFGVAEVLFRFSDRVPRPEYELLYLTRHAALCDIGEEFHIFTTRSRIGQIEDLVSRLEGSSAPYAVYGWDNTIIKRNKI